MSFVLLLLSIWPMSGLLACSSDEGEGRFPGVARWQCYASSGPCECFGLSHDEVMYSTEPQVASCGDMTCCFSYDDDGLWKCECVDSTDACEPDPEWVKANPESTCPPS
jgi:hypothetical protein